MSTKYCSVKPGRLRHSSSAHFTQGPVHRANKLLTGGAGVLDAARTMRGERKALPPLLEQSHTPKGCFRELRVNIFSLASMCTSSGRVTYLCIWEFAETSSLLAHRIPLPQTHPHPWTPCSVSEGHSVRLERDNDSQDLDLPSWFRTGCTCNLPPTVPLRVSVAIVRTSFLWLTISPPPPVPTHSQKRSLHIHIYIF